jgi:hypothetical protein
MQGFSFFFNFFLTAGSQVKKKTWLGQKIGTKNLKWSTLLKIHMFSVFLGQQIFPVAISRDFFFYRFCCQNVHFFRRTRTAVFCVCSAVVTAEPLKILATKTVEKNLVKSPQENLLSKFFRKNKTENM